MRHCPSRQASPDGRSTRSLHFSQEEREMRAAAKLTFSLSCSAGPKPREWCHLQRAAHSTVGSSSYSGQLIPCVVLVLTQLRFTTRASRHSLTDRPLFRVPRCPPIRTLSVRSHCLGWYLLEGGMARSPRATYLLV